MKNKDTRPTSAAIPGIAALFALLFQPETAFAQGGLTPPGPPAPTMKTLVQVEPRTPISALPFTIRESGSYYLTTNLSGPSLVIFTNNVTVDLSGFTIGFGVGDGIRCEAVNNIVIQNGFIHNRTGDGVNSVNASSVVIKDLVVSGATSGGIRAGDDTLVSSCLVVSNSSLGIRTGNRSTVHQCVAEFNGGDGIFALGYNTVSDCRSSSNTGNGITAFGAFSRIVNNHSAQNGLNGDAAGILIQSTSSVVDGNQVAANNRGLEIPGPNHWVVRNVARANGTNYLITGTGQVGPIISGGGTITSENPWANFDF